MEKAAKLRHTFKSVTGDYRGRRRDNGVPEAGQRRHFITPDDFTGLPRTSLSARTMYATINELSQDCIVLLHEDGFQGRKRRGERKQRPRHFPARSKRREPFGPRIIAQ